MDKIKKGCKSLATITISATERKHDMLESPRAPESGPATKAGKLTLQFAASWDTKSCTAVRLNLAVGYWDGRHKWSTDVPLVHEHTLTIAKAGNP